MNTIRKYFYTTGFDKIDMYARITIRDCDKGILYDGTVEHTPVGLMNKECLSVVRLVNGGTTWYRFTLAEEPEEPAEPEEDKITIELTTHEAIMLEWLIANGASQALDLRNKNNTPLNKSDYEDIIEYHFTLFKELNDKLKEGC